MAPFFYRSVLSARDLATIRLDDTFKNDLFTKRSNVRIAVIDDKPFEYADNLRNYGYNISSLGDLKTISEVSSYHLVLCDVMGVGHHFDKRQQGASIIREIKIAFPDKVVIAYSGGSFSDRSVRLAVDRADGSIRKDADIEEWISTLDGYAEEVSNPTSVWRRVRKSLIERNVDTKDILTLEDAYVRSLRNGDPKFRPLSETLDNVSENPEIRSIITGLISSFIFKAISG